jgi:hypothetical protein
MEQRHRNNITGDTRPVDCLGADDFLPVCACVYVCVCPRDLCSSVRACLLTQIHIYVVVQAELQNPLLLKRLLSSVCNEVQMKSEGGYFLVMFEAALEHISGVPVLPDGSLGRNSFFS